MPAATKYHLLADLISTLEADGFVVGTGKHLQVQELLSKLPDDIALESLETVLAPIFATNRQDQERFYELFGQCLQRVREIEAVRKGTLPPPRSKDVELWRNIVLALFLILAGWAGYILELNIFKWWGNPTFLLLLALASGGTYFAFSAFKYRWKSILYVFLLTTVVAGGQVLKRYLLVQKPTATYVGFQIQPGSTITLPVPLRADPLLRMTLCNGASMDTSATIGSFFVDTLGNLTIIAKDSFSFDIQDTICVLASYASVQDTTYFVATYRLPDSGTPSTKPDDAPAMAELDTLPIPFPRDLAQLQIDPEQQAKAAFYQRNAWWIKLLLIALFGAILWSVMKWREKKQRRLVAQLEQRDKPPYIWHIHADQREGLIFGDNARIVLNQVRRRRLDEAYKLDLGKTVEATVRSAGRVDFRFRQQTSPPEYLLLIDRCGLHDHRAELYEQLYLAFRANDVNVERFFYRGDPRLCFNERHPRGVNIRELQHRHGDARLLLVGNGYELLSPGTGQLSNWATIFTTWRERALFTPKPVGTWDRREAQLAERFYLMPASIESLGATLEEFGSNDPRSPQELIARLEDVQWRPIELNGSLISTLRQYYDEPMLQWIAACAVYPHLQWDITLFLGRELSAERNSLLSLENILQLTRLQWFVDGRIPDAAREELLDYLAAQGLEQRIRQRLHWLFDHTPEPTPESVAFDEYRMNKAGNEWRFTQNRSRRRELEEELASYYAAGHNLDTVVFKYLHRERTRLDFEAPDTWKRYIFNNGEAFFGLRDWVWALPLWVLLTMVILFFRPQYEICRGERMPWQGKELCLTNGSDYLMYYESLIRTAIAEQKLTTADSLLNDARQRHYTTGMLEMRPDATPQTPIGEATRPEAVDTVWFLRNLAAHYYNAGVKIHNEWLHYSDSIRLEVEREQTLPQEQDDVDAQNERILRYQRWQMHSDSLAMRSCENFRRGSQLFTNATRGAGYDFLLAMQKTCKQTPTIVPTEEAFSGTVRLAGSNRPIAGVLVKTLNGNVMARTKGDGRYELLLPIALTDSLIRIEFSASGYATHTEELRVQEPLAPVELEPLQEPKESVEIYTYNGMRGLRTTSGRNILPANYYNIERDPASGLYRVQVMRKSGLEMGYINENGNIVVPIEYRVLGFLRDGLILAAKERYGYLDRRGNIAISFIYEGASDFNRGEAEVIQLLEGQRFTFIINKDGRCVRSCPPESVYVQQKSAQQVRIVENIEPISLYFDVDATVSNNSLYSELYARLISAKSDYYPDPKRQNIVPDQESIDVFFRDIQGNYNRFNEAMATIARYLSNTGGKVEITLRGFAANSTEAYNQILSVRRIAAVKNSILEYNNGEFRAYEANGRLIVKEEALGSSQLDTKQKNALRASGNELRNLPNLQQSRVEVIVRFAN